MCLIAMALDQSSRFPFVLAANRDEYVNRASQRLDWWQPEPGAPAILGGRDLEAGGTWLGLTALGRLAMITNIRNPKDVDPTAPSRGQIVPQWLKGDLSMGMLWPRLAMSGYNGFNLLALDFAQGDCFWINNRRLYPERLQRGLYGLSNAQLNTPWPKVQGLKAKLKSALHSSADAQDLSNRLFAALADPTPADDASLPRTGVPLEVERMLSPAFIRSADGSYGTRCSTVIITERINKGVVTHVLERSYDGAPGGPALRQVVLKNWPPRHNMDAVDVAQLQANLLPPELRQPIADDESGFESSVVSEWPNHVIAPTPRVARTRARNLIRLYRPRPLQV